MTVSAQEKRRYIIAVKHQAKLAQPEWQERAALVPGVSLVGATPLRIQVDATEEAIEQVSKALGEDFFIEELVERTPAS